MDHTGAVTVADYERNYQYHSAQPNTLKLVKDELNVLDVEFKTTP